MFLTKCKMVLTPTLALAVSVFGGNLISHKVWTAPLEEVQAAPATGQRDLQADLRTSQENLKQIGLAMHTYHDNFGHLPPAAIFGKDDKALLSWRVAILPFIDQDALFKEFKLEESWDSPHNLKLLPRMPTIYAPPGIKTAKPHTTFYRVFVGPGTVFDGKQGCRIPDITDGTANTLMVVEAGAAVPWTKPDELPYQKNKAVPELGGVFQGDFNVLTADGSVFLAARNPNMRSMHLFIQRDDGNAFVPDNLRKE
jgi:hypothetical protein